MHATIFKFLFKYCNLLVKGVAYQKISKRPVKCIQTDLVKLLQNITTLQETVLLVISWHTHLVAEQIMHTGIHVWAGCTITDNLAKIL